MSTCPVGSFPHTIQPGDTIWLLAQRYNTAVDAIIAVNTGIEPGKLTVGQVICIPAGNAISKAELDLSNEMRKLWEEHVAWTRMFIISVASNLPDLDLVTQRLLRNATDMAEALKPFYGEELASRFGNLIRDHLIFAAELVKAAKAGNSQAAADAERRWYTNADEIATFLSNINPNWSRETWMKMLHEHLSLTKSEAVARLTGNYAEDIATYDKIENQALVMADEMTNGIVKQFPNKFGKN